VAGDGNNTEDTVNGKDRRCSDRQRVKTIAYIDLGSSNGGMLIDVSEGGLSFQGIHALQAGQVFSVNFKLSGIDQSFRTTGQIVWLNDSRKGGGLRFIEPLEETRNLLKGWISEMAADDLDVQPAARPRRIDMETGQHSLPPRAAAQSNRPSAEANRTLADLLRDSSLSREAIIAVVNASRSANTAAPIPELKRTAIIPDRPRAAKSSPPKLPAPALRMPLVIALAALLCMALFQHFRGNAFGRSSPAPGDSTLGLDVERKDGDLRVRWNRNSNVLARAVSGTLSIADGPVRKDLAIDVSELQGGYIIYTPVTDDVYLFLQVLTKDSAQPVSESVRIVAGKTP
jgi:hypothetical protein